MMMMNTIMQVSDLEVLWEEQSAQLEEQSAMLWEV